MSLFSNQKTVKVLYYRFNYFIVKVLLIDYFEKVFKLILVKYKICL